MWVYRMVKGRGWWGSRGVVVLPEQDDGWSGLL